MIWLAVIAYIVAGIVVGAYTYVCDVKEISATDRAFLGFFIWPILVVLYAILWSTTTLGNYIKN